MLLNPFCLFQKSFRYSLLLLIFFTATALTTAAQKYKLGQRVELNVDDKGVWYKGYIKEVQGFESGNGYYLVHLDEGVPQYGGGTEFTVTTRYFGMMRPEGGKADPNPANCTFGPPPGNFTNSSPASLDLFKRIVYNRLNMLATGVGGYPKQIGLTFLSFDQAKAYKNTVSVVPGRGAQRINDAAPPNATIYPASMKYIVCEDYNPGITRKTVETKWEFFIDRFGEWTASKTAFDKTTPMEQK
jgi:hypothetical protein